MTTITVSCRLYASTTARIELPEGKTWDDVHGWYVTWDTLWVCFKDSEDYIEIPMDSDSFAVVDWKRPQSVTVYGTGDDGETDYDNELAESA